MRITRDAYSALTAFVEAYEAAGGQYVQQFREMHSGVRPMSLREMRSLRRGRPTYNEVLRATLTMH